MNFHPSEFSTVITCEILCQVGKGSHQAFLNPIPYVFTKQKKSYLTIYSQPILPLFYWYMTSPFLLRPQKSCIFLLSESILLKYSTSENINYPFHWVSACLWRVWPELPKMGTKTFKIMFKIMDYYHFVLPTNTTSSICSIKLGSSFSFTKEKSISVCH